MRILLIDDDEWIRDSLTLFLENEGYRVTALQTAEEGVDAVGAKTYDVVIADYRLPGMDGLEFLGHIRGLLRQALMLLITAYCTHEVKCEAKRIGIQGVINKPLDGEAVLEWVEKGTKKAVSTIDIVDVGSRREAVTLDKTHACRAAREPTTKHVRKRS